MRSPSLMTVLAARAVGAARGCGQHQLLILALALGACAEPIAAPNEPVAARATPATSRVPTLSIAYSSEYSWPQRGQFSTYMGPNKGRNGVNRVCYLTRISGKFAGYSESVRVYLSGTDWYLGGSSSSIGIGARARCVLVSGYSGEVTWSAPQNPIVLNMSKQWMCFLTGVQGELAGTSASNMDWVRVDWNATSGWRLEGDGSAGNSSNLKGRIRCALPTDGDASAGPGGPWWYTGMAGTTMQPTSSHVCVLFTVFGAFQKSSSYLAITEGSNNWLLYGNSLGQQAGGGAKCFS
jgi:hypothetical protein